MPKPKKRETKKKFIKRCIPYMFHNEPDTLTSKDKKSKQAYAVCNSIFDKSKKKNEAAEEKKDNVRCWNCGRENSGDALECWFCERQLPNETEIETLLTDISQTGISAGLDIDYFKPEGLRPKEFYSEYPIKLKVTGRYHEFAEFISGVAALPRIVTVQDITVKPVDPKGGVKLTMELTAITYQYLDESKEGAEQ